MTLIEHYEKQWLYPAYYQFGVDFLRDCIACMQTPTVTVTKQRNDQNLWSSGALIVGDLGSHLQKGVVVAQKNDYERK